MHNSQNKKLKASLLILALLTMSACSSSQVDDGSAPPETAGDAQAPLEASTDAVPPSTDPGALPAADDPALAGQAPPATLDSMLPPADPGAIADAGAPPMGDPSVIPAGDPAALAAAPAPISEAPLAPISDAPPISDNNTSAVAATPVTDSAGNSVGAPAPVMSSEPVAQASAPSSASSAASGDGVSYRVKRGDTLMKIAFENYGDLYRWKEIYESNRAQIADPNAVPPGTQLTLNGAGMVQIERNGERYLIKHGETLGVISGNVYGTPKKWKKLWENNRQLIKDPNRIYAGFYLFYQPEGRLTHDQEAPVEEGSSAQNLPFRNQGQTAQEVATAGQEAMQAPANGGRVPASKK